MKNRLFLLLCFVILCSHDMFLKMETFFLEPNQKSVINLYNGTFEKSENVIDRDRMIDVSLVGNGERLKMTEDQWSEKDSITTLHFTTGNAGTWVAGLSTKSRLIEMDADAFNNYLVHDGITDLLEYRRANNLLENSAVEKYSKHVKAIFQVGDTKTTDWNTNLGYPIEFIPQSNPYEAHTGDVLKVQLLRDSKPLADQLVYADYKASPSSHSHATTNQDHSHGDTKAHTHEGEDAHHHDDDENHAQDNVKTHSHNDSGEHSHAKQDTHSHDGGEPHAHDDTSLTEDSSKTETHEHTSGQKLRTDANGMIDVKLTADGFWFLRTIHLVPTTEEGLTHESNWATLTFEVRHSHSEETHTHTHGDEDGIPSYIYWIGSIVLLGGLFLFFNRKK